MKKPYKKPSNTKQLEYKIFKLQSRNTKAAKCLEK